jgi:hypothetical protein
MQSLGIHTSQPHTDTALSMSYRPPTTNLLTNEVGSQHRFEQVLSHREGPVDLCRKEVWISVDTLLWLRVILSRFAQTNRRSYKTASRSTPPSPDDGKGVCKKKPTFICEREQVCGHVLW